VTILIPTAPISYKDGKSNQNKYCGGQPFLGRFFNNVIDGLLQSIATIKAKLIGAKIENHIS
jgi:hypothetical protein